MLINDFFKVNQLAAQGSENAGTITGLIAINRSHSIFEGHFPGIPVVPGVCMMQMIKEIVEMRFSQKYVIRSADQVKFLAVINPDATREVSTEIQFRTINEQDTEIAARLYAGSVTFFKLKARFTAV